MFMSVWNLRNKNILNIFTGDGSLASYYSNYFVCKEPSYTFPAKTHEFNLFWANFFFSLGLGFPNL